MTPDAQAAAFQASLPYSLDPFQVEAIAALAAGHSVLVAAPTGTGKTVVAEFGVVLARGRGQQAIYTTPIKALSNQKFRDFRARYGEAEVGLLTGDVVVNPDAPIRVVTTEVLRNMLVTGARLDDVGVIVFDEVHYMGDPERGTAWEESILLAPRHIQMVCLSATVPNASEVAEWIREAHGDLTCIFHDERAVPLEHRYWLPAPAPSTPPPPTGAAGRARASGGTRPGADFQVHRVMDAEGQLVAPRHLLKVGGELAGRVRWGGVTSQGFRGEDPSGQEGGDREARATPEAWRVVRYLEGEGLTPAIYFLFSRRATEEAAASCLALGTVPHAAELVRDAQARLSDLAPQDRAMRQVALLMRMLPRGVAVHHAGMLPQLKMVVEELFQSGRLRAVFATDTLALGINMPARTVVVGEMQKYDGVERRLLYPNEYRQMTGRAGRRGLDERGVSVVLYSPWVSFSQTLRVLRGELMPLESAFRPTYSTAINLWHGPEDEERLADLSARSLRRFQHDRVLKELTERKQALEDAFERERASGNISRDRALWERAGELSQVDYQLRRARREATLDARRTVHGLVEVLERYDYLRDGRPTRKAPYLRALFDTNALTLAELLTNGQLEALEPSELAEALSWFATDRDAPMRGLRLTTRLHRLREALDHLHGGILREEERHGLQISRTLPLDFHGVALAWAEEQPLAEIASRARLQEGDVVGALQKTLDLLGQLRDAARCGPLGAPLLPRLEEADRLLRRGVVEASYRWAVRGLPDPDEDADLDADGEGWDLALHDALLEGEPSPRASRRPGRAGQGNGPPRGRRPGPRPRLPASGPRRRFR